jgi:hypothetical protein
MINYIKEPIKLVLKRTALTEFLTFEKFAILDIGAELNKDGSLPRGRYGVYYRVINCEAECASMIMDYSMTNIKHLDDISSNRNNNIDVSIREFFSDV